MNRRVRYYSSGAVAGLMGVSASWFSSNWRRLVEAGHLPRPNQFNRSPKFPAAEIDRIVEAGSFEDAPKPARPLPVAVGGDPELRRRAELIASGG